MENISKENAIKIYNFTKECIDEEIEMMFDIGTEIIPVQLYTCMSISDINVICNEVVFASFVDDKYNHAFRYAQYAKCIVEYFTNLPLPEGESKNGDKVVNLNLCYELIFGENGLYAQAPAEFATLIDKIDDFIGRSVEFKKNEYTNVGILSNKIMDLIEYTKHVLNDMYENPSTIEKYISNGMAFEQGEKS